MGWNGCVLELLPISLFLSLKILFFNSPNIIGTYMHCNYYIYLSNLRRIWKLLGLFKSSAFSTCCPDDIKQLLPSPVSAFPFPELGGSLEPEHLCWQLMLQMMDFSVENVCSLNTTPTPCCTKYNFVNIACTSHTTG